MRKTYISLFTPQSGELTIQIQAVWITELGFDSICEVWACSICFSGEEA